MMPRLRQHVVVGELLRAPQEPERLVVVGLAAAHLPVQAAHGLDVVVEDLGARADHGAQRLLFDAEEVRRQHLDRRVRQLRLDRADRRGVVRGALVGDVVAVDGRHDDVLQLHLRRGLRDAAAARAGRPGRTACRSGRSSSGRRACTCRRGSGTSRCRGPSTRRCSGSAPLRRSCAARARGSASGRRSTRRPCDGARTFIHSGRRGRSATGRDVSIAAV